jgi:hypothetical protein
MAEDNKGPKHVSMKDGYVPMAKGHTPKKVQGGYVPTTGSGSNPPSGGSGAKPPAAAKK